MFGKFFLLILIPVVAFASPPNPAPSENNPLLSDSLSDVNKAVKDSVIYYYADLPADSSRSQKPTIALFKSILIPGWGQLGNKKYVKAALVASLEIYLISNYIHYAGKASDAKKDFQPLIGTDRAGPYYEKYRSAKDDRNFYGWMTGGVIFISMFDAYVDAHLARFPKYIKGISLKLGPLPTGDFGAVLSFNF